MVGRIRSLSIPGLARGHYSRYDSVTNTYYHADGSESYGLTSTMEDTNTSPGHEHDLLSTTREIRGGILRGSFNSPGSRYTHKYDDYCTTTGATFPGFPTLASSGKISDFLSAVANSHPGEPPVSIPNFLFELKDIPSMLMHAGKKAKALEDRVKKGKANTVRDFLYSPKAVAEDWLNYNFGWRPFVKDVKSIGNLTQWAAKRIARLENKQYVRTWGDLGEITGRAQNKSSWNAGYLSFTTVRNFSKVERHWWVAHWRVNTHTVQAIKDNQFVKAANMANLGNPIGVIYDAIPWSWLVDWFVDVGSLIDIHSNNFGTSLVSTNHMKQTTWEVTQTMKDSYPGLDYSSSTATITEKWRSSGLPSVLDSFRRFNFLNESQLATLASLSVTKNRGVSSSF